MDGVNVTLILAQSHQMNSFSEQIMILIRTKKEKVVFIGLSQNIRAKRQPFIQLMINTI